MIVKTLNGLESIGKWMAVVALLGMMVLTVIDVCGRYFLNKPLVGAQDITELMLVAVIFFGLSYTSSTGGNVRVELLISRLSSRSRDFLMAGTTLFNVIVVSILSWRLFATSLSTFAYEEKTAILQLPIGPMVLIAAIGCTLLAVELAVKFALSAKDLFISKEVE